jgi:hypothetical protein
MDSFADEIARQVAKRDAAQRQQAEQAAMDGQFSDVVRRIAPAVAAALRAHGVRQDCELGTGRAFRRAFKKHYEVERKITETGWVLDYESKYGSEFSSLSGMMLTVDGRLFSFHNSFGPSSQPAKPPLKIIHMEHDRDCPYVQIASTWASENKGARAPISKLLAQIIVQNNIDLSELSL